VTMNIHEQEFVRPFVESECRVRYEEEVFIEGLEFAGGEDNGSFDYSEVAGAIPAVDISCERRCQCLSGVLRSSAVEHPSLILLSLISPAIVLRG
jgi:hypothetical protein